MSLCVLIAKRILSLSTRIPPLSQAEIKRPMSTQTTANGNNDKLHLEVAAAAARAQRDESVEWALATARETPEEERRAIGDMDYSQLKAALQSGRVSAFAALCSALEKSVAAHEKTNCAVLFLKDSADVARALDEKAADSAYVKPPMFGMPFSSKEGVPMKGHRSGVPFVQTNVPISMMGYETVNAVWGTTTNPFRADRTPGGSTGGEGALIGGGGSHIGIGGDVGGSIRIPASFCGIAGFKPTGQRLSLRPYGRSLPGRPFVWLTDGPMGSTFEASVDVLKLAWDSSRVHDRDPSIPPVPWRESLFSPSRPYTIGLLPTAFHYPPSSGVLRVLDEASSLLSSSGHRVVPFVPPDMSSLPHVMWAMRSIDGGRGAARWLDTELVPEEYAGEHEFLGLPIEERLEIGARHLTEGEKGLASRYTATITTPDEAQRGVYDVYTLRESFLDAMAEQGVDAILCPSTLTPALKLGTPLAIGREPIIFTSMFNFFDFAAGSVPMGHWTATDSDANESYSEFDSVARTLKDECRDAIGLPLSVQIAAPPFRDELALRLLLNIEKATKAKAQ